MKKITFMMIVGLLLTATTVFAADKASDDQALVAASFQQGGDAADPAAPVTTPVAAPQVPQADPTKSSALSAPVTANTETPASTAAVPASPAESPAEKPATDSKLMTALSQQTVTMQNQMSHLRSQNNHLRHQMKNVLYANLGIVGLIILLLVLLWMIQYTRRSKLNEKSGAPVHSGPEKTVPIEDDTRGEYDFMGSSEGIPAKLDLARAYIAMEDYTAARETLAEILGANHEEYRTEARALLNQLNS